ncbi:MAG: creatininase family protein [Verrucomicrobia bacterium]|nr:creatininase family protein [Verrucomicrobiota bacterium]
MNIELARMTSREVRHAITSGYETIVVACGAIEQHGPHLPLFVDSEHGSTLAKEVALRLGSALWAPTIQVGCSAIHMNFPGTISLRESTFTELCLDYCTSLARHGFNTIFLIPSHGGNFGPLHKSLSKLNQAVAPDTKVVAFTDLAAQIAIWRRVIEAGLGLGNRVGGHADIAETSIMLALHPELVRSDLIESGFLGELTQERVAVLLQSGIDALSPNGILGNAHGATEAAGRQCIKETVDVLVEYLKNNSLNT